MDHRQTHFINALQGTACYIGDGIKDDGGRTGKHQFPTCNIIRRWKQHTDKSLADHRVSDGTRKSDDHIKFDPGGNIVI